MPGSGCGHAAALGGAHVLSGHGKTACIPVDGARTRRRRAPVRAQRLPCSGDEADAPVGRGRDRGTLGPRAGMTLRLIERVQEAVVIAEFLRAEVDSPRFGPRVRARLELDGRDPRVLDQPDTSDADENDYRAALLHGYRGTGGSAPLLEGLPEEIEWHRALLPRAELGALHYIDYP